MKTQNQRSARYIWKKGPVAKKILFSYLFVLLLPLILTLVIVFVTVSRLQAQSAQHTEYTAAQLSLLLSAHIGDIQVENARISLMDETRKLSSVDADVLETQNILDMRQLQRQLPKDTVASDYIKAIYICFPRNGVILNTQSVYYDYNAVYMLRNELGMSLDAWKAYLASPDLEGVSLLTGDLDHRGHILVAKRIHGRAGFADVAVISEFNSEEAIRLMDEFSENGTLMHSLVGEDGTVLAPDFFRENHRRYVEINTPLYVDGVKIHLSLRTLVPNDLFLRQTAPLLMILFLCFLALMVFGLLLTRYFTQSQYTPIERLNESLLASLNRNEINAADENKKNEFDQMSEAVSTLLQTNATSRAENEQLRENLRSQMLQGVLYGTIHTEDIILQHAKNNGIRFAGNRFLVALYTIVDFQQEESSRMLMQDNSGETLLHLDKLIRTAINQLPDNGSTQYSVEIREKVACVVSLPDTMSEKQIWKDAQANIQQIREFFRDTFGLILTVAVSRVHRGVVSITTCYRECRETSDYMELLDASVPFFRHDQIPSVADGQLSFPEVLEKEKKLCRNLVTCDYRSAEASWQDLIETLSLRTCSFAEARARLMGAVTLMSASLNDLPSEMEDRVCAVFNMDALQQMPDLDSMLGMIGDALADLAGYVETAKKSPEDTEGPRFIAYVNEHITDPNFSISMIAEHFDMSTSYFSKRFKKSAGENLLDYIHRQRLTLVKQIMAEQPEITLKNICDQVGYSSPLTLNRVFRKYEGVTPSEYRTQMLADKNDRKTEAGSF